jgi:hypothetical protein
MVTRSEFLFSTEWLREASNFKANLVFSVFPLPLSPEMIID